ncbi:MAG TPA: class I SAM-dependent methyltransferase [Spongiibacteraceae bacterium]|jgi:demethylmenaquinone methyltransferase/2-methoxy-6-polyprenyl-1,4-benzoquinol methylase
MEEKSSVAQCIMAPHIPLTQYYADESTRAGFIREMFDSTAEDYDLIERVLGLGRGSWYRGTALERAGLKTGMKVLDVGIGTGLVAREAVRIVGDARLVTGLDPSPSMMEQAQLPGVTLVQGFAESLPFPDASFDFLSMGYALRHISDLSAAFREFQRVLKPGGKLCLLEISCPASPLGKFILKNYMRRWVPLVAMVVARKSNTRQLWRYYWDTIEACVPPATIVAALDEVGLRDARRYIDVKIMSFFSEYQATKTIK